MRWKLFIATIAAIIILRFFDLYITYLYTPDLNAEWNPLVSLFGLTWRGFIMVQIIIVAFVSFLMFFYCNRTPVHIDQKDLSFHDFIHVYFFDTLRPWPKRILSMPKNLNKHLVFNGFIFMQITLIISLLAIVNNLLLILQVNPYIAFIEKYYRTVFPMSFVLVTLFSVYLFFAIEYGNYNRSHQKVYS